MGIGRCFFPRSPGWFFCWLVGWLAGWLAGWIPGITSLTWLWGRLLAVSWHLGVAGGWVLGWFGVDLGEAKGWVDFEWVWVG